MKLRSTRSTWNVIRRCISTDQLAGFPEFQAAVDLQKKGKLSQAFASLNRVHEVLSHALGSDNPLTNDIFFRMASLALADGQFAKATRMMQEQSFDQLKSKIGREIFLSNASLLQGKITNAIHHGQLAVDIVEGQEASTPDNTLFSAAYSSLGRTVTTCFAYNFVLIFSESF